MSNCGSPKPTVSIIVVLALLANDEFLAHPDEASEVANGRSLIKSRKPFLLKRQLPSVDLPLPVRPTKR